MSASSFPVQLEHPIHGPCRLLRIEGMNWVVEVSRTGTQLRIPVTRKSEFTVATANSQPPDFSGREGVFAGALEPAQAIPDGQPNHQVSSSHVPTESAAPSVHVSFNLPQDKLRLRKAIESLRNGLPPITIEAHKLTVGLEDLDTHVHGHLNKVGNHGGSVKIVRGAYGQGKTLSLNLAAELALQQGFWIVQTEVDASERRLDKPSNIYRGLMQSLKIPRANRRGISELVSRITCLTRERIGVDGNSFHRNVAATRAWLERELECPPLAWLLCDPALQNKQMLCGLLEGDSGWPIGATRKEHIIPGTPYDWPKFSAGSQGDFACFLLSGLGRLARLLGDKGLVIILDEMEKWEDLSWNQQTRAGNLIGGLIWAATEQEGRRERSTWQRKNLHQPEALQHSGRAGGFPFTTLRRAHLGLIIALTPRGYDGPEELWSQFGPIDIFDLPAFTASKFGTYIATASAHYAAAYDLPQPKISQISGRAHSLWHELGDGSTRTAVRATIQALDEWRETLNVR